ncbi:MAG: hypothetical protein JKY28_03225 [Sulfurimonas sp.]|nr:hypothetical protein [Sulfurimonas sp.]PHQ91410.1 MAG: hypothetical protein COB42_03605 [Sulfurimonas sp.]
MCIPHGVVGGKSNGFVREEKPKKHIPKVSQAQFEHGDSNFIDERISSDTPKKKSFFSSLFE